MSNVTKAAREGQMPLAFPKAERPAFFGLEYYREYPTPLAINISGGRSSALQAWHFIEANGVPDPKDVIFNFQNTGLEDEAALVFVDKIDRALGLNVHWIEYDSREPTKVRRVSYETASRNGEPFDDLIYGTVPKRKDGTLGVRPLPNPAQRTCTAQLKIKTLHRYVRNHLGWPTKYYSAIGYRRDEKSRYDRRQRQDAKKGTPEGGLGWYPMYLSGVTSEDIDPWWSMRPMQLGIEGSDLGNCNLCLMMSEWRIKERMLLLALRAQAKLRPESPPPEIARWIGYEERESDRPGPFRRDRPTYRVLWEQVCAGNMQSTGSGRNDVCLACTD